MKEIILSTLSLLLLFFFALCYLCSEIVSPRTKSKLSEISSCYVSSSAHAQHIPCSFLTITGTTRLSSFFSIRYWSRLYPRRRKYSRDLDLARGYGKKCHAATAGRLWWWRAFSEREDGSQELHWGSEYYCELGKHFVRIVRESCSCGLLFVRVFQYCDKMRFMMLCDRHHKVSPNPNP